MIISSSDGKCSIPLGGYDTWKTLCSTVRYHLGTKQSELSHVFAFLENSHSEKQDCLDVAREFNLVRDALSQFSPDQIVYDENDPKVLPPWGKNISPVITSCANYLTDGNGNDLLAELVKIFTYAAYAKSEIVFL